MTDVPALHFKEELAAAYPNARIVLSIRDSPAAWLKSMRTTLIPFAKRTYDTSLWSRVYRLFLPRLPFQQMNDEMMYLSSLEEFEKTDESEYIKHSEAVKELAKEHDMQILEFNVKSGWAPLAEFLGKEVPKDEQGEPMPFPRVNDSANFNEKMAVLNKVMNILVAVNVVCTTLGTYALVKGGLWAWGQYGDEILRRLSVR